MDILHTVKRTINRNSSIQKIWHRTRALVKVNFFYLVQEGRFGSGDLNLRPRLDHYEVRLLQPCDIGSITDHPETPESEEACQRWLAGGCICLYLMHKGNIAAYTWADLSKCEYQGLYFPLKKDEAYLFSARTFQAYRGKNLAPYLRYELYRHLAAIGRIKAFSTSDFFNAASIKFKSKLNARPLRLYIQLTFFRKYRYTGLLKSYGSGIPPGWSNAGR